MATRYYYNANRLQNFTKLGAKSVYSVMENYHKLGAYKTAMKTWFNMNDIKCEVKSNVEHRYMGDLVNTEYADMRINDGGIFYLVQFKNKRYLETKDHGELKRIVDGGRCDAGIMINFPIYNNDVDDINMIISPLNKPECTQEIESLLYIPQHKLGGDRELLLKEF